MLRAVLVRRADDLHGGHEPATAFLVVDQDFVDVLARQVGYDGKRRPRRSPDGGRDAATIIVAVAGGQDTLLFETRQVDLGTRSRMDAWLSKIAAGQRSAQQRDDHHRPGRVKALPVAQVIQWWAEMVTQGHELVLLLRYRLHQRSEGPPDLCNLAARLIQPEAQSSSSDQALTE